MGTEERRIAQEREEQEAEARQRAEAEEQRKREEEEALEKQRAADDQARADQEAKEAEKQSGPCCRKFFKTNSSSICREIGCEGHFWSFRLGEGSVAVMEESSHIVSPALLFGIWIFLVSVSRTCRHSN